MLKHKLFVVGLAAFSLCAIVVLTVACYSIITPYKKYIVAPETAKHTRVGIVLGAGVAPNGKPYDELQARLDKAADAINDDTVDMLILSGDNRFKNYDEPTTMFEYLISQRHIPADKLHRDYAGRSTYASCERAAKVFQINEAIIFSANSHLPRAIYLCRHFDINAHGIASDIEANNSTRRELLARVKAVLNVKVIGEQTVLGEPIPLD